MTGSADRSDPSLPARPSIEGLDLAGRRGLVLGATGGLGSAVVAELRRHGAELFVHGHRNRNKLAELCAEPEVTGSLSDLGQPAQVAELFAEVDRWGGGDLGFLVYCAGINPTAATVQALSEEDWQATLAVNLTGAYLTVRRALPMLRGSDPGKIVLVSSIFGVEAPSGRGAYAASKHGLTGLIQSVSKEEGRSVHINGLCPGPAWGENVRHIFVEHARSRAVSVEEYSKQRMSGIPAGRFLEPFEFARIVALFCSRMTDYVNGEVIKIAGGAAQ